MKKFFLFILLSVILSVVSPNPSKAQNVGINNDAMPSHSSAMLDVRHAGRGLLIPRVALTGTDDAATVPAAATSLLVYNTATTAGANGITPGYYYWNGAAWLRLITSSSSGNSNAWLFTGNAGTADGTSFIGTIDNIPFSVRVNNEKAGRIDHILANTFWGYQAANSNTTGTSNTGIGYQALHLSL